MPPKRVLPRLRGRFGRDRGLVRLREPYEAVTLQRCQYAKQCRSPPAGFRRACIVGSAHRLVTSRLTERVPFGRGRAVSATEARSLLLGTGYRSGLYLKKARSPWRLTARLSGDAATNLWTRNAPRNPAGISGLRSLLSCRQGESRSAKVRPIAQAMPWARAGRRGSRVLSRAIDWLYPIQGDRI